MYRLLAINRITAQNVKLLRLGVHRSSTNSVYSVPVNWQTVGSTNSINNQLLQVSVLHNANVIPATSTELTSCCCNVTRTHSTMSTKPEAVPKKRKPRRPRYAHYVELLEVTNLSASERRNKVKRLRAKKLQDFIAHQHMVKSGLVKKQELKAKINTIPATLAQQPCDYSKINLEALDSSILQAGTYDDKPLIFFGKDKHTERILNNPKEIQNILKSFNNFRDIIETMEYENRELDAAMDSYTNPAEAKLEESEFADRIETLEPYVAPDGVKKKRKTKPKETTATAKARMRYKSKVQSNQEQERLAKEYAIRFNITAYLHVCVSSGMLNAALSTIVLYRQRAKRTNPNSTLITIDMYNTLLHGYAEKGAFDSFQQIFNLLKEDNLSFNEQTFAAIFECLGRLEPTEDNVNKINHYINKASDMNFTLDQIMNQSKFIADQRDMVLDALRQVKPDFEPKYVTPEYRYDNSLLNTLNEYVNSNNEQGYEIMKSKSGYTKEQLEQMARSQLKIELDGKITITSIEKSKQYANAEFCREKLKELEKSWRTQIAAAIVRDLNTLRAQIRFKSNGYMNFYTYLRALDPAHYVDILLDEIYKLAEGSETYSPTVGQLYKELGQKVQQRYQIEQKKKNGILEKVGDLYGAYCDIWESGETNENTRQIWQRLVHEHRSSGPSMDVKEMQWSINVLTGVGRFLYNILMRDLKIDSQIMRQQSRTKHNNYLPAFYTLFRNQGRLVKEEVKPHPVLAKLLRTSRQQTLTFDSNIVPMLCPPQPWSTPYNGGYLLNKSDLIRLPSQAVQQWERIDNLNPQHMYPSLDSLNQLASIPWRVNTDILDVIIKVFQDGGDDKLNVPRPSSALQPPLMPQKEIDMSIADRAKLFKEKLMYRRKQAEMFSLWCDTLYRLSLANHYRNKVFWLPHNMDFRGRVYPIPPHLNHLGSDLARSMLVFDQPKPLGTDGFVWLKLHCINLTGLKKRDSVHSRLLYAEKIMDQILDSADNPLTGEMWWANSDEPWQTLACCMEIAKVYRSPNPEEYISRFPIHQDGSCNGLQHYAALGRDKAGAFSVNLAPSSIPQDVYSTVATLVEKARRNDANNGLQVAQALDGYVRRKVIKQTVMTTVYGVTRYGARLQIARQLKDIDDFPKDWVWPASTYLTTKTFESLREMFTSTREIQDWFTECARLISGVCGKNVEWTTPLGLPVVQPYSRQEIKQNIRQNYRVSEKMLMDMYERPNVMKQKNAFPPNFIHSLDSSHMMLTSLHCERKGLTFVSVHDCFWTHACTVPDLNKICRQQFVALHSEPVLEDLSKFLVKKFSFNEKQIADNGNTDDFSRRHLNRLLHHLPQKGDFDLNNVLDSVYFFS
ncbi:DNA-directed RNA polymerase, mitochondrial [Teleopsis dalmanni]|uniref:DNA-directed RNA polymerase, mitochondrial n=1 Tax=Teleopsis dalmanni TaxID=139649 RepID=UPI0018CCB053|nr:DNA-directed RNA polymerase, mitochondrial [Teleopsis dalmanni]